MVESNKLWDRDELVDRLEKSLEREIVTLGSLNLMIPRIKSAESPEDVNFWCDVLVNNVLTTDLEKEEK